MNKLINKQINLNKNNIWNIFKDKNKLTDGYWCGESNFLLKISHLVFSELVWSSLEGH